MVRTDYLMPVLYHWTMVLFFAVPQGEIRGLLPGTVGGQYYHPTIPRHRELRGRRGETKPCMNGNKLAADAAMWPSPCLCTSAPSKICTLPVQVYEHRDSQSMRWKRMCILKAKSPRPDWRTRRLLHCFVAVNVQTR